MEVEAIHERVEDEQPAEQEEPVAAPVEERVDTAGTFGDARALPGDDDYERPLVERADPDEAFDGEAVDGVDSGGLRDVPVAAHPPSPAPDQRRSVLSAAALRADFGAHLEANYQRLVAQLYAITLDPGEAHDVVQDAYSRAWRKWETIGRSPDPAAWVRRVAVRSTVRSWRRVAARLGVGRSRPVVDGVDPRTRALLAALGRLSPGERRAVVLFHMAGAPLAEIAAIEQVSSGVVQARLARARGVVTEGMADVLPAVLGQAVADGYEPGAPDYEGADYEGADYDYDGGSFAEGTGVDAYGAGGPGTGSYSVDRYGTGGFGTGGYADGYGYDQDARADEGERR